MTPTGTFLRNEIRRTETNTLMWFGVGMLGFAAIAAGAAAKDSMGWAAICGAIAAICTWVVYRAIMTRANPQRHLAVAALCKLYNMSLEQLSAAFEQEASSPSATVGSLIVLPSWLYQCTSLHVTLVRIDEVAWVYKKSTTEYRNNVKQGTTHQLIVRSIFAPEREITLTTKSTEADQLVRYIGQRAPWALLGWDAARKVQWDSAAGRKPHVDGVIARRHQMRASA